MSASPTKIGDILRRDIQAAVTDARGSDFGRATSAALGEVFDSLGNGIERKLRAALEAAGQDLSLDDYGDVADALGKTVAKKLADKVILQQLREATSIRGVVGPLNEVKDALGSLTEEELDSITKREIEAVTTRPAKKSRAADPDPAPAVDPDPPRRRPQPRPPVTPRQQPSFPSSGGWGGKGSPSPSPGRWGGK